MRPWFRFVMAALLALALPAQGLANAVMLHCGSSHQRMHTAQVVAPQAADHHQHHGAAAEHSHSADHADHAAQEPVSPDKLTDLGQYKCSSCASCCAGMALPSTVSQLVAPEPGATVFAAVAPGIAAFATDGPDRPPRRSLAH
jgi:hypothetical protein